MDHFYIFIYEYSQIISFQEIEKYWFGDIFEQELDKVMTIIDSIDFKQIEKIENKIRKEKSGKILNELYLEYNQITKDLVELKEYMIINEQGLHFLVVGEYIETYQNTLELYSILSRSKLERGNKTYSIDDNMILEMAHMYPGFYRESCFINSDLTMFQKIEVIRQYFDLYLNQKYPIISKNIVKKYPIECSESKNGILRGIVHQLGHVSGDHGIDHFCEVFKSEYLRIQTKDYEKNEGIFSFVIGNKDKIQDFYSYRGKGVFLILSLSVLEDFDYWVTVGAIYGTRSEFGFYKGICHECDDQLKKYSSAERGYLSLPEQKEFSHEIVFTGDINLKRYVEAIYVPGRKLYREMMSSEKIDPWIKNLITNADSIDVVYRNNCIGDIPPTISDKQFNKISKLVHNRKKMLQIPVVKYESLNKKKYVKLVFDRLGMQPVSEFPSRILYKD
jgi:hypothetical protein